MSERVHLTHGLNSGFLIVLALFGVGMIGIGIAVAVFADAIHQAQPESSELQWYVSGAVVAVIGILMVRPVLSNWGAVAAIDVDSDGSWDLISRFGRVIDSVDEDDERALELHGVTTLVISAGFAPRRRELVRGYLVCGDDDTSYKLAQASPDLYDGVLDELGYDAHAPRPGEELSL
jgi:hypothetical protein